MRADRLLAILLQLQSRGRLTSRELAEELEVSERTVHRDMEALSAAGIPIYAERGARGGWVLPEGYRTSLTGMKTEEIESLLLASPTSALRDLGMAGGFDAAFQRLLAALPGAVRANAEHARQRLHVDGAGWHRSDESFPALPIVRQAVWEDRKLHIRYNGRQEADTEEPAAERTVHPLGLVAKRGTWYLAADTDAGLRTFRVSRLQDVRLSDESFTRPQGFDLAEYWEASTEQFKEHLPRYPAVLRVTRERLTRLERERYIRVLQVSPATVTLTDMQGTAAGSHITTWLETDVEFHTLDSACESVLAMGPDAEVLRPEELRRKVLAQARAILARYEN